LTIRRNGWKSLKGIGHKDQQNKEEEGHGHQNQGNIGQKLSVFLPILPDDNGGKEGKKPRPKKEGTLLSRIKGG